MNYLMLEKIKEILGTTQKNKSAITFFITHGNYKIEIKIPDSFIIDSSKISDLKNIHGIDSISFN